MSIKASNNPFPHDPDDNWKEKLDRGGYPGTAKDLFDKISQIDAPDGILIAGEITRIGNVFSIGASTFTCRIKQEELVNQDDFSTTIVNASDNYKRIDILVFTKFSTILKIQGDEDLVSAKEPDVPTGTIKLAFFSIFGNQVDEHNEPIIIPDISEKLDRGGFEGTAQDIVNAIPDPSEFWRKLDKDGYDGTAQTLKDEIDSGLLLKENKANKATDFSTVNDILFPTVKASKTYTDNVGTTKLDKNNAVTSNPQAYIKKADGTQSMFEIESVLSGSANKLPDGSSVKTYVDNGLSTKENLSNKAIDYAVVNDQLYPTVKGSKTYIDNGLSLKENLSNKAVNFDTVNDILYPTVKSVKTQLDTKIPASEKGSVNGVASLGNDGKIPNSQIPALAISETFPVNSQVAMLALSQADQGDIAIRSDISKSFILRVSPASVLGNWSELLTPTDSVQSVNGQVGNVNLTTADLQDSTNKRYQTDNQKLFNDATSSIQTQLNARQLNLGFTPEPAFAKNTAFNKNFGVITGTVAEGNDARILNGQTAFGWGNHASAGYALSNGSNASGTWGISITGNSASATKWQTPRNFTIGNSLKSVDGSSNMVWTHVEMGVPATDGTYATGTWGINISGNSNSATNWGGVTADFTTSGANLNYLAGFNTAGVAKPYDAGSVKTFLGLSSAITGAGTGNRLSKFTGTGTVLGDSNISDNGSNVTIMSPLQLDSAGGGNLSFRNSGVPFGLFASNRNIQGSGSTTDLNVYVYDNNPFGIWTNGVKRVTVGGEGNATFAGSVTAPTFNGALSGNATSASSATTWKGQNYDSDSANGNLIFLMGYNSATNQWSYFQQNPVKSWLGLNDGSTLSNSISGNASTATNWGGYGNRFNEGAFNSGGGVTIDSVPIFASSGIVYRASASFVNSFLGINNGSTLANSISGNANTATSASTATSSENTTRWGGATADFTTFGASIDQIVARNTSGVIKPYPIDSLKGALGLGSNAYTSTAYLPLTGGSLSGSLVANGSIRVLGASPYYEFLNTGGTQIGYIQHDGSNLFLNATIGSIILNKNTTVNGTITASGGFFNSDKRLKDIIKRDGNVAYFKWKDGRDDKTHIGYIAQEVQKTNPDQVIKGQDGILSVNYTEMLVLKVKSLENRVRELEGGRHGVC